MRRPGLSGLSLAITAAGMVGIYAAVANATISDTLRALLKGQKPPSRASTLDTARTSTDAELRAAAAAQAAAADGTGLLGGLGGLIGGVAGIGVATPGPASLGEQIAAYATGHLGAPYKFGAAGPNAFDCSGLVTYVLHTELGLSLPSNSHTVTGQWYVWPGAVTVGRPPRAGDLICWTGHIGIALNDETMIHAPGTGQVVKTSKIWWNPAPLVRRVRAQ